MEEIKFEDAIKKLEDIAKELENRRTRTWWKCCKIWRRNEIIKDLHKDTKWSRKEDKFTSR